MEQVASQVEPAAQDITEKVIRPGGQKLADNAVPVTEEITRGRIEPAVDQVTCTSNIAAASIVLILYKVYLPDHAHVGRAVTGRVPQKAQQRAQSWTVSVRRPRHI